MSKQALVIIDMQTGFDAAKDHSTIRQVLIVAVYALKIFLFNSRQKLMLQDVWERPTVLSGYF